MTRDDEIRAHLEGLGRAIAEKRSDSTLWILTLPGLTREIFEDACRTIGLAPGTQRRCMAEVRRRIRGFVAPPERGMPPSLRHNDRGGGGKAGKGTPSVPHLSAVAPRPRRLPGTRSAKTTIITRRK